MGGWIDGWIYRRQSDRDLYKSSVYDIWARSKQERKRRRRQTKCRNKIENGIKRIAKTNTHAQSGEGEGGKKENVLTPRKGQKKRRGKGSQKKKKKSKTLTIKTPDKTNVN